MWKLCYQSQLYNLLLPKLLDVVINPPEGVIPMRLIRVLVALDEARVTCLTWSTYTSWRHCWASFQSIHQPIYCNLVISRSLWFCKSCSILSYIDFRKSTRTWYWFGLLKPGPYLSMTLNIRSKLNKKKGMKWNLNCTSQLNYILLGEFLPFLPLFLILCAFFLNFLVFIILSTRPFKRRRLDLLCDRLGSSVSGFLSKIYTSWHNT